MRFAESGFRLRLIRRSHCQNTMILHSCAICIISALHIRHLRFFHLRQKSSFGQKMCVCVRRLQ